MNTTKENSFQPRVPVSKTDHVMINLKEKVGTWTYGDYYRGTSKKNNKDYMVRMVDITKFPLKQKNLETEIGLLQKLKTCPYAAEFMEYKYYEKTLVIVTDSYNRGDLRSYLKEKGALPEDQAVRILMQLVCGLKALHQLQHTHAALRPENILLHEEDGRLTAKLSNFIFARAYKGDNKAKFPLPYDSQYLAPEVLRENIIDPKSDIWSLGIIFYEMLFGTLPWSGKTKEELRDNIINKKLDLKTRNGISDTSMDFISRCLQRDLKKRIDWKDITDHRLLFRALFMNDDGTYKLFNDEFKESSPSRRNLMYGIRSSGSSMPASPKSTKSSRVSSFKPETPKASFAKQHTIDLNSSAMSTVSNFVLRPTSPYHLANNNSPKSTGKSTFAQLTKEDTIEVPSESDIKDRSASPISVKGDQIAPQEEGTTHRKPDPEFYSNLVSKVGDSDDYYLAKFMNKEPLDNKGPFSKKTFVRPFKWLANKAEIVSEIYEMALRNRNHCCYERIIQILNSETASWNTLNLVSNIQKQFTQSVEGTSKAEEDKPLAYPKTMKNTSVTKHEKSQQIYSLIEDIVGSLTNANENCKANNEDMVQIAANFKILREYDEIGDSVMKELDVMKNSLIVFYRKRDHSHIRYLLLIRNLA